MQLEEFYKDLLKKYNLKTGERYLEKPEVVDPIDMTYGTYERPIYTISKGDLCIFESRSYSDLWDYLKQFQMFDIIVNK